MSKKFKLKSYDFLMQSTLERVKSGLFFDNTFKPYTVDFLLKMIGYFESQEKYEECQYIKSVIDNRLNHEKNYKNI